MRIFGRIFCIAVCVLGLGTHVMGITTINIVVTKLPAKPNLARTAKKPISKKVLPKPVAKKPVKTPTTAPASAPVASTASGTPALTVTSQVTPGEDYASDDWMAMFSQDSDGFTQFPMGAAVVVGFQPGDAPDFKTAEAVCAQNGLSVILFRRGETFTATQINDNIQTSGASPDAPFIVGATPDTENPMPIMLSGFGLGNGADPLENVVVCDLDFYADQRDPSSPTYNPNAPWWTQSAALRMISNGDHLWIEGCRVRYYQEGIELQAPGGSGGSLGTPFQTAIVRRNVIDHCYGDKFGLYTYAIQDQYIVENFLDHDGWNVESDKSIFNHDAYLQIWPFDADSQCRVVNNTFARASSHGCQQRPGGLNQNNLYVGDPIAGFVAVANSQVIDPVIIGAGFDLSIGAGNPRGDGFESNACAGVVISGGIFCDKNDPNNAGPAMEIKLTDDNTGANVPTNIDISTCIVDNWSGTALQIDSGTPGTVEIYNNGDPAFSPPNASSNSLAAYAQALGLEDAENFLSAAALQRRGYWSASLTAEAVNDYIRGGYTGQTSTLPGGPGGPVLTETLTETGPPN
jgi:hypothetical protein